MSEALEAIFDGRRVGAISYARDRLRFQYDELWRESRASFPLSLSMPLTRREHDDAAVRPFIWGLLPDDNDVLRRWGQRFQVSARNPFRLLSHVGEECAGAVQFVRPEHAGNWLAGDAPEGVSWLTESELAERISDLVKDRGRARRMGDEGQFSLAGVQAKTGLYLDSKAGRWGIPKGVTPTTHILEPDLGAYAGYDLNEHFCLQLARQLGLPTAKSWTERIGEIPVIIVERFDRVSVDGRIVRVHQEDTCQALARMPDIKYQNQGGPSAAEIFGLIRDHSTRIQVDVERFLGAVIYNWVIGGTDAHAKNYGFLLAGGGRVRLAPLYDLSSCLPYPRDVPPKKAKLAMKIGGEYLRWKIGVRQWEKAAAEWNLDRGYVRGRITQMAEAIPEAAAAVASTMEGFGNTADKVVPKLHAGISKAAEKCLDQLN